MLKVVVSEIRFLKKMLDSRDQYFGVTLRLAVKPAHTLQLYGMAEVDYKGSWI